MDEVIKKLLTVGLPALLLAIAMRFSGKTGEAAVWTGLEKLGNPFGMRGGLCLLVIVGLVINSLIHIGLDGLLVRSYQKRRESEPPEKLLSEIDRWPISQDLKIKLKWAVIHNNISWGPNLKQIFERGFIFGTVLLALISLTGYGGKFNSYLELTSHLRSQYLLAGLCPLFFFLLKRRKKWIFVSLLIILINLAEILPWYLPQPEVARETKGQQVRILQSNVYTKSNHYSKVISLVRQEQPDIAVFVEVNPSWAKKLEDLQDILPYFVVNQDSEKFGTAIYSKLPLKNKSIQAFVAGGRQMVSADVSIQGKEITIIAIHPNIPTNVAGFQQRNKQLAELANYIGKLDNPVLALGDWNITMWSPFYKEFVAKTKLQNARSGFGILPTWPTHIPLFLIPIDHCLVSPNIKVLNIRRGRNIGSDHLPLITDLSIPVNPPGV